MRVKSGVGHIASACASACATMATVGAVVGDYATDATGRFHPTDDADTLVESLHDAPPDIPVTAVVGKEPRNLLDVVRLGLLGTWASVVDEERIDCGSLFDDGRAAITVVAKCDVPDGALIRRSDMLCDVKPGGRKKCRWVNDGSVRGVTPAHVREVSTHSPCALSETVLMLFALSAYHDWCLISRDVTKAFLQADAHTRSRYYVYFPPGFSAYLRYKHDGEMPFDPREHLGLVVRNMYGDEDAARLWCEMYSNFLCNDVGCARSPIDSMLFVLRRGPLVALHAAHVDDGLTTGNTELVEYLDAQIAARFPPRRTDGLSFSFAGFEYERLTDGRIRVYQGSFAAKLVAQHGFTDAHPASTPLLDNFTALGAIDAARGGMSTTELDFPSALGGIGYLTRTRPGLKFLYGVLTTVANPSASCPTAPTPAHYQALARGLRYIKGTLDRGLIFDGSCGLDIVAYKDAGFAREIATDAKGKSKSRSGYVILLGGAALSSASVRQVPVALSTAEAEIYALMLCVRAVICTRRLLSFALGVSLPPTVVFEDNDAVIKQLHRRDLTARTRHLRLNFGFVLKAIDDGDVDVVFKKTSEMVADYTTKMDAASYKRFDDYATGNI